MRRPAAEKHVPSCVGLFALSVLFGCCSLCVCLYPLSVFGEYGTCAARYVRGIRPGDGWTGDDLGLSHACLLTITEQHIVTSATHPSNVPGNMAINIMNIDSGIGKRIMWILYWMRGMLWIRTFGYMWINCQWGTIRMCRCFEHSKYRAAYRIGSDTRSVTRIV